MQNQPRFLVITTSNRLRVVEVIGLHEQTATKRTGGLRSLGEPVISVSRQVVAREILRKKLKRTRFARHRSAP